MHDRLRLDIAVSEGREIFSWHGEGKFTSSDVSQVVRTGPISSGSFVGFLHNIFLDRGARFTYTGYGDQNGLRRYCFDYAVPRAYSAYHIQAKNSKPVVPFHGSFSIDGSDFHLASLQVIADALPSGSAICSAETNITYQMVNIAGQPSLIPEKFVLQLDDDAHIHTASTSEYSQCREFRGESSVHFEFTDSSTPSSTEQSRVDQWLPAGISLIVGFRAPVDDRTAYVGDPVEGVLLHDLKIPGSRTTVPKGALLEGLITTLEDYYQPEQYQVFSVKFNRLNFGHTSFLLNAFPKTSNQDERTLRQVYGSPLPPLIAQEDRSGVFVVLSSHLHLGRSFAGQWITGGPPADAAARSSQ